MGKLRSIRQMVRCFGLFGAILHLVLLADLEPGNDFVSADIVVEYGPVKIGDETYICPLKGVAFLQVRQ